MLRLPFLRQRDEGHANLLDRAPLLALLEPDLRQRVHKRLTRRRIKAGKPLFRPGELADGLYLVESGRFRIFVSERAGHERVLQFLGPGEIIGEAAFMAETAYVTHALAIEDAVVVRLSRTDFDALLGKHDAALRYLGTIISQRQARANARLAAESAPEEALALRGFLTAVYSPRGGAGATTIALNLGIALAERHPDDVALLDLDAQFGHTLSNVWLEARGVLAQASPVTLRDLDRSGLERYLVNHASSLRIFPAAMRPEEGQSITADHVRAALQTLRRHFGYIVLDLAHAFSDVTLAGLELADRVILVATPERTVLGNIVETRRIFDEVLMLDSEHLCHVLNHPQPYSGIGVADFAAATASPWLEIGYGGDVPAVSALRGQSLIETRRNNAVTRGVLALAEQVDKAAAEAAALAGRTG